MRNDVLVMSIFHQKSTRYCAKLHKSQSLIQMKRRRVAFYHRTELQDAKFQGLCRLHTMPNKFPADSLSAHSVFHRITCVAYMPAPAYIVRMQDIKSHNVPAIEIISNGRTRLRREKSAARAFCKHFRMRENDTGFHNGIPDSNR